jgi:hypothetical protein
MQDTKKQDDGNGSWLPPWRGGAKLISLSDMKEYLTPRLVNATAIMSAAHVILGFTKGGDEPFEEKDRKELKECVVKFQEETVFLGLPMTAKVATRFLEATDSKDPQELSDLLGQIESRFFDEAGSLPLFYVHQDALKYYNKTDLFGEQFKANFPRANAEVIEAGNCFAFDRFSAAVFHLTRAMEIVLHVLFVELGMSSRIWSSTKWSKLLDRIKGKIEKNNRTLANDPRWQSDKAFYENAHAFLAAVRIPIRNATIHVETVYDEAGAENVFGAVKIFMRHIVTKLKEQP